ncbi:YetF domain-containing protein [Brassicibacter mesophilus]|uniref:YetF domain-containing protein n=1 Tax=Brassicibacter mesophilus TaxID=745119 RepID=UPI003D1B66BA
MKLFIEVFVQTLLAFFSILYITRLLGRQQVSQLTFHEYINGITFGSIAATLATDVNQKTWQHLLGLILFGVLTFLVSLITLKKRSVRKVLEGEPILVIQNGQILENNMKRTRYNVDDLGLLLRQADCFTPDDVEYGILEMNGLLSVIKKGEKRNVTLGDLDLPPKPETIPTELIIGGQIIYENLRKREISGKDLINNLNMFGVNKVDEVMYATIDENGKMYVDKYDDKLKPNTDFSENNNGI